MTPQKSRRKQKAGPRLLNGTVQTRGAGSLGLKANRRYCPHAFEKGTNRDVSHRSVSNGFVYPQITVLCGNAFAPIVAFFPFQIAIDSASHPRKAPSSAISTLSGRITECRSVQLANAPEAMLRIPSGRIRSPHGPLVMPIGKHPPSFGLICFSKTVSYLM